jgi:hypothetical protein
LTLDEGFEAEGFILSGNFNFEPIDYRYGGSYEFVAMVADDSVCDAPNIVDKSSVSFSYFPITSP